MKRLLNGKFVHPRRGRDNDNSHPPIHPTRYVNNLAGEEKKLYDFIVRHFLACCSDDARGLETKIEISIASERFHANGLAKYFIHFPFKI